MASLKILRLGFRCNRLWLWKHTKSQIFMLKYRHYEGKPFDQTQKNWVEEMHKNRHYDIDQNIYDFRRKTEEQWKEEAHQNEITEQYRRFKNKGKGQNVQQDKNAKTNLLNFSYYEPNTSNTGFDNGSRIILTFMAFGIVGIGFLFITTKD